jgi:hypothetical protein
MQKEVQPIPQTLRPRGAPPDQVFQTIIVPHSLYGRMYRLRELTVSPHNLCNCLQVHATTPGMTWTRSNFVRGLQWCRSHPSSPKIKKDSFLGLGCCVSYRPVWSSENAVQKEKKKENFWAGGAPRLCQVFGIGCSHRHLGKECVVDSGCQLCLKVCHNLDFSSTVAQPMLLYMVFGHPKCEIKKNPIIPPSGGRSGSLRGAGIHFFYIFFF